MATFFLILIYITFISLGLPDSLLGSAWAVMRIELGADLASAGILTMVVSGGTILSSLMSERIIRRFGTGKVTAVSVLATAVALLGFSRSPSFVWLVVAAIPLGLGAGSVDAGLNNYVALHYKPHHMSWLHCFWGIGAFSGPLIMAQFIQSGDNWRGGYLTISIVQLLLVALLFFTLPLWKRQEAPAAAEAGLAAPSEQDRAPVLRIRGVVMALTSFFFYSGVEATTNLWGSSFLVEGKSLSPATAARWISMFFVGITVGRLLTGFVTMRVNSRRLILVGELVCIAGAVLLLLPLPPIAALVGLILVGLGCAPIFPCMLHETPHRFGNVRSQKIMGIQMATSYTGGTFLPPLLGLLASKVGVGVFPPFILICGVGMLLTSERLNRIVKAAD